jgi:hypothetical protein
MVLLVARVIEPVVRLELDPGRSKQVERLRGHELGPLHQLLADLSWARLHECRHGIRKRMLQRDVTSEARTGHPHFRVAQIVVLAARRAKAARHFIGRWELLRRRSRLTRRPRVVQVVLPELNPQRHQVEHSGPAPHAMPRSLCIDRGKKGEQQPAE